MFLKHHNSFDGTMHDYDFTSRAVKNMSRIVSADDFSDMDADLIFHYLFCQMELVSFRDHLKRYIYERAEMTEPYHTVSDSLYCQVILDSFIENKVPFSFVPTTRHRSAVVKSWLKQKSVGREVIFLLGFGLRMTAADVSSFLVKVIKEHDFDLHNPEEVIFWYCYNTRTSYHKAVKLLHALTDMNAIPLPSEPISARDIANEEQLLGYIRQLHEQQAINLYDQYAVKEWNSLYQQTKELAAVLLSQDAEYSSRSADSILPSDIERIIYSGIPVNEQGNLEKSSRSLLSEHFQNKRLSRQRMSILFKRQSHVNRFDLLTLLFFIYSQRNDFQDVQSRYQAFITHANTILVKCGMMELYPVNPYEAFILMCLLTESPLSTYAEVYEKSYSDV